MLLEWCMASTVCAVGMFLLLVTHAPSARLERGARVWWLTWLLVPGQVLPLVLLWLSWKRTYYVIPFLGPPILVGMTPVWWATVAVLFSYLPAVVYAAQRRWSWSWVLLHPYATVRLIWRAWRS